MNKSESNGTIGKITHVTLPATAEDIKFNTCYPVTRVFYTQDLVISQLFIGASVCPSTSHANIIKIKAGASLPDSQRICIVPVISPTAYKEVCLTVSSEENVELEIKNSTKDYIVRESDLALFKTWAANGSVYYPAYAYASFAFVSTAN
jgi:hypothetical protein